MPVVEASRADEPADRLWAALLSLEAASSVGSVSRVARLGSHHLGVRPGPGVAERLQLVAADPRAGVAAALLAPLDVPSLG